MLALPTPSLLLALSILVAGSAAARSTGDAFCTSLLCCSAVKSNDKITYTLRRSEESIADDVTGDDWFGWAALGFGNTMANSPMVIVWPNPAGGFTISQREASSQVQPEVTYSPSIGYAYLDSSNSFYNGTSSSIQFIVDDKGGKEDVRDVIWAYGATNPRSTEITADLRQHQSSGATTLDFSQVILGSEATTTNSVASSTGLAGGAGGATAKASLATGAPVAHTTTAAAQPTTTRSVGSDGSSSTNSLSSRAPYTSQQRVLVAHAVFGGLGMMIFLPFGVVLARLARSVLTRWVKWHWLIQVCLTAPAVLIAFALGVSATQTSSALHFSSSHRRLGLTLFILLPLQLVFGALIHTRAPPTSMPSFKSKPLTNYLHPLFGVIILLLGWVTVWTGFGEWKSWSGLGDVTEGTKVAYGILIGLFALLYLVGLSLLPRQTRIQSLRASTSESPTHRTSPSTATIFASSKPRNNSTTYVPDEKSPGSSPVLSPFDDRHAGFRSREVFGASGESGVARGGDGGGLSPGEQPLVEGEGSNEKSEGVQMKQLRGADRTGYF